MEDLKRAIEYILTPSAPIFVVGALIVLLVPLLIHYLVVRNTPYTSLPSILLVGPPGAGKTSFLTLLERGDRSTPTHTSQVPTSVELTASSDGNRLTYTAAAKDDAPGTHKKFLLIDTPGHGKLRNYATKLLASTQALKGVVFVLDASTLDDTLASTASYLYDLLLFLQKRTGSTKTSRAPTAIQVLIAANKSDLFTALPASLVRSNMEAEIGRIRKSRSKGLLDSGVGTDDLGAEEHDAWLGEYGSEKFGFGQLREFDIEVDIVAGSVLQGQVDKWWEWIGDRL